MIKNYFKTAWRGLLKGKWYSVINIAGLATGLAIALVIGLWIRDECLFDTYHLNHKRLARVMTTEVFNGTEGTDPAVSIPVAEELRTKWADDFKEVVLASWNRSRILASGEKKITGEGMYVQPAFPAMFTLKMLSGNIDGLKDPSSLLITASLARALFGTEDVVNRVIKLDNEQSLKVAGVYEDLPRNTTLSETKFLMAWDAFASTSDMVKQVKTDWEGRYFQLFVQLNEHADINKMNAAIRELTKPHQKAQNDEIMLHPMDNWHLYNEFKGGRSDGGRIQFVWLFGIIGVFVLLLACINFMNLSTARSEKRAKEVGIRKSLGSLRGQLVGQFLSESILVTALAALLAVVGVYFSLPLFNMLSDKSMVIPWSSPLCWGLLLGIVLLTGLVSGCYPAFYLSAFRPVKVLKGAFKAGRFASLPRKALVVIQFTVSIALIIGTIVVFREVRYAQNRPNGYNRDRLIVMNINTPDIYGRYNVLRNALLQTGVVEDMTESNGTATEITDRESGFEWRGKDPQMAAAFNFVSVTHDYGKTVGWSIKEGRDYSRDFATDTGSFILNEAAVKLIGIRHPVGEHIKIGGQDHVVTGVARDMVMESPYEAVKPTIFLLDYHWTNYITIRIKSGVAMQPALAKIESMFRQFNPGSPFTFKFTDEEFARKFSDEQRTGKLAAVFASLAIFISCLGLFGLASFVAEQRAREIGIRKVLGASVFGLWGMLSRDFVGLVLLSCLIAIPVTNHFLDQWLQRYEYRIGISGWVFVLAGGGALMIALLTVSYQAIKAALMSPVKALRSE